MPIKTFFVESLLQVLMVRFSSLFNVKEKTVTFISGATYSLEALKSMGMGDLLGTMFDFSEKLNALELSAEELGLFTAVVLVSAGMLHIRVEEIAVISVLYL